LFTGKCIFGTGSISISFSNQKANVKMQISGKLSEICSGKLIYHIAEGQ